MTFNTHKLTGGTVYKVVLEDSIAELAQVGELLQVLLELTAGETGFKERGDVAEHKGIKACWPEGGDLVVICDN